MMKPCVLCSGIDKCSQSQLADTIQSLQIRMANESIYKIVWDIDKSEDGIVYDFSFLRHGLYELRVMDYELTIQKTLYTLFGRFVKFMLLQFN